MLKLNTDVIDKAVGRPGRLTHCEIQWGGALFYNFQPAGLNLTTKKPLDDYWIPEARVTGGVEDDKAPVLPLEVLGTLVKDESTGYQGVAVAFMIHLGGCVHVMVQSQDLQEDGERVATQDYDIRRLTGDAIPKRRTKKEPVSPARYAPRSR